MYFYSGNTKSLEIPKPPPSKRFSLEQKMQNVHRNGKEPGPRTAKLSLSICLKMKMVEYV